MKNSPACDTDGCWMYWLVCGVLCCRRALSIVCYRESMTEETHLKLLIAQERPRRMDALFVLLSY